VYELTNKKTHPHYVDVLFHLQINNSLSKRQGQVN